MKEKLINYYTILLITLLVFANIIFKSIKITGIIYNFIMILLIVLNVIFILKHKDKIKYKKVSLIIFIFLFITCKNVYYLIFVIINIVLLFVIILLKSSVKAVKVILLGCLAIVLTPLIYGIFFILYLSFSFEKESDDIYEDTHYYCENNYEVYIYSMGAMDGFHYNVGKYYVVIDFDNWLNITYRKRNETTKDKYDEFLNNHKCELKNISNMRGEK